MFKSKKKGLIEQVKYLKDRLLHLNIVSQQARKSRDKWIRLYNKQCDELNKLIAKLRACRRYRIDVEKTFKEGKEMYEEVRQLSKRLYKRNTELQLEKSMLLVILDQAACGWKPDIDNDEDFQKFHTDCGHTYLAEVSDEEFNFFALETGTKVIYCPYCGKGVYIKEGDIANVDSNKGQSATETK